MGYIPKLPLALDANSNWVDIKQLNDKDRPNMYYCPECDRQVKFRLTKNHGKGGRGNQPHFYHKTTGECALTIRENFIHESTKYHIYRELSKGTNLYLKQECSNKCGERKLISWAIYNKIPKVEPKIGSRRPDILIVCSDGTSKAIEIRVTHAVEPDKATDFENERISWIEVEGSKSLFYGKDTWTIDQPLPIMVVQPKLADWICPKCQAELDKQEAARLKEARDNENQELNYEKTIYSTMADFYFPSGGQIRFIYYLRKVVRDGKPVAVFVIGPDDRDLYDKRPFYFKLEGDVNEELLATAFQKTNEHIKTSRAKARPIIDPYDWLSWEDGSKYHRDNFHSFPWRYERDEQNKEWKKIVQPDIIKSDEPSEICLLCGKIKNKWWFYNSEKKQFYCDDCWQAGYPLKE